MQQSPVLEHPLKSYRPIPKHPNLRTWFV